MVGQRRLSFSQVAPRSTEGCTVECLRDRSTHNDVHSVGRYTDAPVATSRDTEDLIWVRRNLNLEMWCAR